MVYLKVKSVLDEALKFSVGHSEGHKVKSQLESTLNYISKRWQENDR